MLGGIDSVVDANPPRYPGGLARRRTGVAALSRFMASESHHRDQVLFVCLPPSPLSFWLYDCSSERARSQARPRLCRLVYRHFSPYRVPPLAPPLHSALSLFSPAVDFLLPRKIQSLRNGIYTLHPVPVAVAIAAVAAAAVVMQQISVNESVRRKRKISLADAPEGRNADGIKERARSLLNPGIPGTNPVAAACGTRARSLAPFVR